MSYCIANMIGIRTGGVFSCAMDMEALTKRVAKVASDLKAKAKSGLSDRIWTPDLNCADPSHCMSKELTGHKGSMVVLAGVFNYWSFEQVSQFASALSEDLGTEVMLMSHDLERDTVQCQVFLAGRPLHEVHENPIGRTLRRTS